MLGVFGNMIFGQTKEDLQNLRQVSLQSLQHNTSTEYHKYLDYYSKANLAEALPLRIKASLIRGNYGDAITYLGQLRRSERKNDPVNNFSYHYMAYQVSHALGIEAEADKQKKELITIFPKVNSELAIELAADSNALDFIPVRERKAYLQNVLVIYQQKKDVFFIVMINYLLGTVEYKNHNNAYHYFLNSYQTAKKNGMGNMSEFYGTTGMASIMVAQRRYTEAFDILAKMKNDASSIPDLHLKEFYYRNYAKASAAVDSKTEIEWASDKYQVLIYDDDNQQIAARSQLVDLIENYNNQEMAYQRSFWRSVLFAVVILVIICMVVLLSYWKSRGSKVIAQEKTTETDQKVFVIPDKTEKEIIEKLHRFENSGKFTKGSISLKTLALQLDTNPRYLSEIINKHKDSNFNTYINNLRIDYILKKLTENDEYRKYKVSYLAEESGFSSHSLFTTTFKNRVGRSPIDYIKNIEENK